MFKFGFRTVLQIFVVIGLWGVMDAAAFLLSQPSTFAVFGGLVSLPIAWVSSAYLTMKIWGIKNE